MAEISSGADTEPGKTELESIPFSFRELFKNCRTLIQPKAVEKGLTLYIYAEPSVNKEPLGDPTRLRQVFIGLLSNAVKFTPIGIIKLNALLIRSEPDSITMMFEVRDSGTGMTPGQMEKIFDTFEREETGTAREYGGTGYNLAVIKNMVELMGGELMVESAQGIGSKFSFELTFKTRDIGVGETTEKSIAKELKEPVLDGEVLICEDNTVNQQLICEQLLNIGLQPFVAKNGKIGVDLVSERIRSGEKQFDLIFMDMYMPVMDGLEAAEKITELSSDIPIVAMTANIMVNDMDIYRRHGIIDYVGKPFTALELWNCLLRYFTPV